MGRERGCSLRSGLVGFDLSLSAPAACFIPQGWELGDWGSLRHETHTSTDDRLVRTELDALRWQYRRIIKIVGWAREFILTYGAGHVFVENYAFSKRSSSVTRLAELGGYFRVELFTYGRTVRPVVASFARKLLLGECPKGAKLVAQQALYDHGAPFANGDECDAFVVANAGLSELGLPFLSLASGNPGFRRRRR